MGGRRNHVAKFPFGEVAATGGESDKRRFTSYERDGTGLDYAVNRHYSSAQGRFTQVDPIGMASVSLGDPQSLNLYGYVRNDPVNYVDPLGLLLAHCGSTWYGDGEGGGYWVDSYCYYNDGGGSGGGTGLVANQKKKEEKKEKPKPCDVQIPKDNDGREIVGTLLGEMTSPAYIGQKQYKLGEKVGKATGETITQQMLELEAGAMVDVILNRTDNGIKSIHDVLTAKQKNGDYQFVGYPGGMQTLKNGNFGNEGSADCIRLGIAVGALNSRSFIGPIFPFENWRGVVQPGKKGPFTRVRGEAKMRLGHTDFW